MDYTVVGFTPEEPDETIHYIEIWYCSEPEWDGWMIQYKNKSGDQIDDAEYAHLKRQAIETARQHNVPIFAEDRTTGNRRQI